MILKNKLSLNDSHELAREEERISKKRALELFDADKLHDKAPGSFASLSYIHQFLFGDIYDFVGTIRTKDISKSGFRFASVLYLEESLVKIEAMPQSTFEEIVKKYVEMNVAHPFREGNGRSMRIWLDQMLKAELGLVIDWKLIDKQDYLLAMERSPIKDTEIKTLLKAALTDRINDREVYMKGLDASYAYEGYTIFQTEDLS